MLVTVRRTLRLHGRGRRKVEEEEGEHVSINMQRRNSANYSIYYPVAHSLDLAYPRLKRGIEGGDGDLL